MERTMADEETTQLGYSGTRAGAYSAEEHLKAQQEQTSPATGEPLHDPEHVASLDTGDKGDDTEANRQGDTEHPEQ